MTEQTIEEQTTQNNPDGDNVNISIEQILAAILFTVGTTNVSMENLLGNYSSKQISVTQNEDKSVTFALVDTPEEIQEEKAEVSN
jgi:hypothetical protein